MTTEKRGPPNQAPSVSIDAALEMFLALAAPRGLPEGVSKEEFIAALREKIARDRPDWAAASAKADAPAAPPSPTGTPHPGYSQVKADAVEQARLRELPPTDPEERYLYNRREKARHNREQRQEQEREEQFRAELRERLIAQGKAPAPGEIERVLSIRRELELRVRNALDTRDRLAHQTTPSPRSDLLGPTPSATPTLDALTMAMAPLSAKPLTSIGPLAPAKATHTISRPADMPAASMPVESPKASMAVDAPQRQERKEEQLGMLRAMIDARRAQLPRRESLLTPRRPDRGPALKVGETSGSDSELGFAKPAEAKREQLWPEAERKRARGLTLD